MHPQAGRKQAPTWADRMITLSTRCSTAFASGAPSHTPDGGKKEIELPFPRG